MRHQLVNWFLLCLAISDLCVLTFSFFVFSFPAIAEHQLQDVYMNKLSQQLLQNLYPLMHSSHTTSVYLTILVSVHRYLGVCHPFLIRRISSKSSVRGIIAAAIIFAFAFNIPRWFELTSVDCLTEFHTKSLMINATELFVDKVYTLIYRNACYTAIMFLTPFAILTYVNCKIVSTLKTSNRIRRRLTQATGSECIGSSYPKESSVTMPRGSLGNTSTTRMSLISRKLSKQDLNERKEHGITIMLVAMVAGFLLFNMLAFFNNIIELVGDANSPNFTMLVEVSTLLVNVNGATTIIIYLTFGTKYRNVFFKLIATILGCLGQHPHGLVVEVAKYPPHESTFVVMSANLELHRPHRASFLHAPYYQRDSASWA
uniref:G_PROTEIN_RECEP_F1_2 domain-containing protein n=1 Tax=Panagrellus redivivus TaxID=6233 RepID=A0A7E4ZSQ5_PANRE